MKFVPHNGPFVSLCSDIHKALGALGDYTKCLSGRMQAQRCFQNGVSIGLFDVTANTAEALSGAVVLGYLHAGVRTVGEVATCAPCKKAN